MTDPVALHRSLLTLDSHIDIPWPEGPAFREETSRRVDLPKMRRGHMAAGCFAAYVPQGPRNEDGNAAAFARANGMLQAIAAMGDDTTRLCTTADAIEQAHRDGLTAIIPAVENGHACGGDPTRLRGFRALGARYLTLTHNGHNAFADSAIPRSEFGDAAEEHGGLSPLGREAIAELNRLGMLVDVAHVSRAAMLQAAEASRTPVLSTHSCIRALCDHPRNLDDAQLDALRDVGGVVQVTAVAHFLRPGRKAEDVTLADYADHIDYAVRRIGIEHVGISSDFDGGGGFVGWHDAAECPNLTAELLSRGYGARELALLWGGNFLRLLRIAEQRAA
ncbi:Membrane dipeptidase [Rhodovastum atsumiense]|uniref:Membrane dipeptidase n=1 Tax=Rhodovastum atsumiense TaxID=504468 RepID=A0A5M6IYN4_9PROT|nr:dipeptidase [Rhodovastum atsumiense]KAA5612927.1 membrane dipeptidase [Rhodovastum atsumiense]CAH2600988.1 Membrane dipeptidase [Rhodovastum atsumiense]